MRPSIPSYSTRLSSSRTQRAEELTGNRTGSDGGSGYWIVARVGRARYIECLLELCWRDVVEEVVQAVVFACGLPDDHEAADHWTERVRPSRPLRLSLADPFGCSTTGGRSQFRLSRPIDRSVRRIIRAPGPSSPAGGLYYELGAGGVR